MKLIFVLLVFLLSFNYNGEPNVIVENTELQKILIQIEQQEFLFTNYDLNRKSKKIANKLYQLASETELIELFKKDCKLCFCYAFWVLSKKKSKLVEQIYQEYSQVEAQSFTQINQFKSYKGCVKIMLTDDNFIEEVYKEHKYLNEIK